ncbi:MAG: DUF4352 domain-containing protein [Firmicutes bacterium]|nr:DUF4352 domain-containing protein [Bacillota bacterium]
MFFTKMIIIAIISFCTAIFAACSEKNGNSSFIQSLRAAGRSYGNSFNTTLNDGMETAFFELNINSAEKSFKECEFVPSDSSFVFVVLYVTIKNTFADKDNIKMLYSDFQIEWNGGSAYPEKYFEEGQLPDEYTLEEGESISGKLIFTVPDNAVDMRLTYTENWSDGFCGNSHAMAIEIENYKLDDSEH